MNTFPMLRRIKTIHFIGIGGVGMSGIAEVLQNQGFKITGSDQQENSACRRLVACGANIFYKHDAKNIVGADAIVVSSAITNDNPELAAAIALHIPVLPRAQMLAELMRFHYGIAIAGTHGKTTTTSLIASVFAESGFDPTYVIGGVLNSAGANAHLGKSQYFVVEADESDASFLYFNPMISVVTNIDADHMQTYEDDFNKLKQAFIDFLHRLPFYGLAVVCIDNPVVKEILPQISRPVLTYGFSNDADLQCVDFVQQGFVSKFKVRRRGMSDPLEITLNLPGEHNALNALATIAVATECKVSDALISNALVQFRGVGRRMQQYGEIKFPQGKVLVIDDYGHHPREITATIKAIRSALPNRRLVLAFQPHRYSRTKSLFEDFVTVLSEVDVLLLMEIYPACEKPISGVDSRTLARSIRQRGKVDPIFVENTDALIAALPSILKDNDVLLVQGAGNIGAVAPKLKQNN